jgi:hypothetical protein
MIKYLSLLALLMATTASAFLPRHSTQRSSFALHASKNKNKFDMDELKKRIASSNINLWFQPPGQALPDIFYILLVQPGTKHEGVHTIEYPVGSGSNLMLAFEDEEACERFAELLQDQNFVDPTVRVLRKSRSCSVWS